MHRVYLYWVAWDAIIFLSFSNFSAIKSTESLICMARPVSSMSDEVIPKCMCLDSSPTYSPTLVRKAITSCRTSASISWMRSTSKCARSLMTCTASWGILPRLAQASQAATSIFNQLPSLFSSDQMAPMAGRVYLAIITDPPFVEDTFLYLSLLAGGLFPGHLLPSSGGKAGAFPLNLHP